MEQAEPANADFYEGVRSRQRGRTRQSSASGSLALYEAGDIPRRHATSTSSEEHPTSHKLEASMRTAHRGRRSDEMARRRPPSTPPAASSPAMVIAFSAVSVVVALLLGFVLSWAFILPVRKMERALAGDHRAATSTQRVEVPNRDEFGKLAERPERHERASGDAVRRAAQRWPRG